MCWLRVTAIEGRKLVVYNYLDLESTQKIKVVKVESSPELKPIADFLNFVIQHFPEQFLEYLCQLPDDDLFPIAMLLNHGFSWKDALRESPKVERYETWKDYVKAHGDPSTESEYEYLWAELTKDKIVDSTDDYVYIY